MIKNFVSFELFRGSLLEFRTIVSLERNYNRVLFLRYSPGAAEQADDSI